MKTKDKIINALSDGSELSPRQIRDKAGLRWFELDYPTLWVLENDDILKSRWADEPFPRRRLYKLAK